jgi:hypothetical protein
MEVKMGKRMFLVLALVTILMVLLATTAFALTHVEETANIASRCSVVGKAIIEEIASRFSVIHDVPDAIASRFSVAG